MPHLHFTAAAKKKLQEKKRFTSACVGIYLHKSPDNSKHALPTPHPVRGHLFLRPVAAGIPKLCTGNPLNRTDADLPGKLYFLFFSSTIDPTIHPNGINPGVHDNCLLDYAQLKLRDKSRVHGEDETLSVVTHSAG